MTYVSLGRLIESFGTKTLFKGKEIQSALIRLLPSLKATDAALLNLKQRKMLYYFLKGDERWPYQGYCYGTEFKIAILRALEQIGDAGAIPVVEHVAHAAHAPRVRNAAVQCLPFLQEHARQQQISQTLLRPSSENTAPETLLRAAQATSEPEPQ